MSTSERSSTGLDANIAAALSYFFGLLSGALFFAIAAGAALQVVVEVGRYVARTAPGGLRSGHAIAGFMVGIATMYVTGVLVA